MTRFTERRARGLPRLSLLRARAWAAGVGVREGRTPAPGWPGPREGPRRGARRAIVWAGAPGAVVVCVRGRSFVRRRLPRAGRPPGLGVARVWLCVLGTEEGKERTLLLISGLPRLPQPLTCTFLPQFPIYAFPASASQLPFSSSLDLSGLGIARCSREWTWKSFAHPGSKCFTSVVCRRCLNLRGAGKEKRTGASSNGRWSLHLRARAS